MEKEEKKADLEQLLNSLIEKGWKPFKLDGDEFYLYTSECGLRDIVISYYKLNTYRDRDRDDKRYSYRELVSKESGLWQFVCENEMVKGYDTSEYYTNYRRFNKENFTECRYLREYQYRLIESSLKDESELEDFLLNSIKLD